MKTYLVGGAVRDMLLGRQSNDKDYVVVGSSPDEMLSLGFKQVGRDFPVFLHPETREEYALARKEIKTGDKHTDFVFDFNPNITLEEDLLRRDFTINAMAYDMDTKEIIDPFNGKIDIISSTIRHVNAKYFIQDPLRVLRCARFSAQLRFDVAPSTITLCQQIVKAGMLLHLTPERIWKEVEKALQPGCDSAKFFKTLKSCDALEQILPEVHKLVQTPEDLKYHPSGNTFAHTMIALNVVEEKSSVVKFAVLCHDLGKAVTDPTLLPKHHGHDKAGLPIIDGLCARLRIPNNYKTFAKTVCENHMRISYFNTMKIATKYDKIKEISDGFKNIEKFDMFLSAIKADWFGEENRSTSARMIEFCELQKQMLCVLYTMKGKTYAHLADKHKATLDKVDRDNGKLYGTLYREYMIDYLRTHLIDLTTSLSKGQKND